MKLLLTGFDPFGGQPINPALEAVKLVADKIGNIEIVKLEVGDRICFAEIEYDFL